MQRSVKELRQHKRFGNNVQRMYGNCLGNEEMKFFSESCLGGTRKNSECSFDGGEHTSDRLLVRILYILVTRTSERPSFQAPFFGHGPPKSHHTLSHKNSNSLCRWLNVRNVCSSLSLRWLICFYELSLKPPNFRN